MSQQVVYKIAKVLMSMDGRMSRSRYWSIMVPLWFVFWLSFSVLNDSLGITATNGLFLLFLGPVFFLSAKRLHDTDKSAWWLLIVAVPVAGPVWLFFELGMRRGTLSDNRYGEDPLESNYDYLSLP
jgi:uncharacterized membrane protein YhaH (DUF805 family)